MAGRELKPVGCQPGTATLGILAGLLLAAAAPTAPRAAGLTADPYEPNDSWSQATALQNATPLEAWIAPDGDHDWYTFQQVRSGQVEVNLGSLPADYDLYLAWRNPQTQQLDGIPYQNQSGTIPERFTRYLQSTGTYYLRVYAAAGVYDELDSYLLTATWPGSLPPPENTLAAGMALGASGTQATVAVVLANDSIVKALQADLRFDPAVAAFAGGQAVGRAAQMSFAAVLQTGDRVRLILYHPGAEHLTAADGAVANLTFTLVGAAGSQCALTPCEVMLADLDAQALPVKTVAGALEVIDGARAPNLRVFALRNPGRPRTLQLFAASDQALAAPPVVTAGGQGITMSSVDGAENLYLGFFHAAQDADSVSIRATGTNGTSAGAAQATVIF